MFLANNKNLLWLLMVCLLLIGCAKKPPPNNAEDICSIFKQYPEWYWATRDTEKAWGVPVHVQMAIMHQESSFKHNAKPERTKLLGFIPWKRPSTAKGYSQVLNQTWADYQKGTGKYWTKRHRFHDASDFIGWYGQQANQRAGIGKQDAYHLYLAYHDGIGGYMQGSYQQKDWLMNVAKRVEGRSASYHRQLQGCQVSLKRRPWYRFW